MDRNLGEYLMGFLFFANDTFFSGSTINMTPPNTAGFILRLRSLLKTAGWKSMGESDFFVTSSFSTTFGVPCTNIITNNSSSYNNTPGQAITGSMQNRGAFFIIQSPTTHSFCFQISSGGSSDSADLSTQVSWRVKYSPSGFNMSTATLTRTPRANIAGEELILLGAGTDASPTFAGYWQTANMGHSHMVAEDGSEGTYGFLTFSQNFLNKFSQDIFVFDSLRSTGSGDTNPHAIFFRTETNLDSWTFLWDNNGYAATPWVLVGRGSSYGATREYIRMGTARLSSTETLGISCIPQGMGQNPFTGYDADINVIYSSSPTVNHQSVGQGGYKGISKFLNWSHSIRKIGEVLTFMVNGIPVTRMVAGVGLGAQYPVCLTIPFSGSIGRV